MIEFDKDLIFRCVFGFLWVEFLWETYLSIRQVESVLVITFHRSLSELLIGQYFCQFLD